MANENQCPELFENLLFTKVFRTFRIAIQPTKLLIALLALAVVCLAGRLMDFGEQVVVTEQGNVSELSVYLEKTSDLPGYIRTHESQGRRRGVFSVLWQFTSAKFDSAVACLFAFNLTGVAENAAEYLKAVEWAFRYHPVYCLLFAVIKLVVFAVAGGAICRVAALQFARGEKPGLTEALRYSTKRFASLITAPLTPIGIIAFIGLFIFLIGLTGNIPRAGEVIVAIFTPLALILGALATVVLIGAVAGLNLMYPAIAYDGSDCFDAISRSFSYVYARPWRMAFYSLTAIVYGAICYTFVRFFAFLLIWSTRAFVRLATFVDISSSEANQLSIIWPKPTFLELVGSGNPQTLSSTESAAALLIWLFLLVVVGLLVSFVISFYFSAHVVIYGLMRNKVDGTALDDVYSDLPDLGAEPVTGTPATDNDSQAESDPDT